MSATWTSVRAILTRGFGVASSPSRDYPYGTLERQFPLFKDLGLDLSSFFAGTLNLDIQPFVFELLRPAFTFFDVRWTDLHPPETFSFAQCRLQHAAATHPGWIYYPHPETKIRHHQAPSIVEVIAPWIPGLRPGTTLNLLVNPDSVAIRRAARE